jgi:anti-sigma factor RsiW
VTLQHPLDKLSAVVDGELDHDSRDKVLSHLVGCDACRSEVDAQRRLKTRLAATLDPEPSTDLMQRLLGVPSFSPEPREEVRPVLTPAISLSPQRSAFPAARTGATRPGTRTATRSRRRTGVLGAAGSAAAVASLLGTAFVLGDPARQEQPPALQPPVASFSSDNTLKSIQPHERHPGSR